MQANNMEQAAQQPTYAQLRERGVRSASSRRPGTPGYGVAPPPPLGRPRSAPGLASTAPAAVGGRYGARTPPPAPRPVSAVQKWQPRGDTRGPEPISQVQLKWQQRQQES